MYTKYVHVHVIHVDVAIDLGNALTCTFISYHILYMFYNYVHVDDLTFSISLSFEY